MYHLGGLEKRSRGRRHTLALVCRAGRHQYQAAKTFHWRTSRQPMGCGKPFLSHCRLNNFRTQTNMIVSRASLNDPLEGVQLRGSKN